MYTSRSKKDAEEENERQFKEVCRPRLVKPVHDLSHRKFLSAQNYALVKQYRLSVLTSALSITD